jgi:hypothetical protein
MSRAARLCLAALLLIAWTGAVPTLAQPASPRPKVTQEAVVALLKRLCRAAAQELQKPGADPSDVRAKALQLQYDVQRTFAFVRDEIAFEPYRGVLRGARGALAARAANALDKSLLLKELLESGGHEVRLMRGQLPPEKARGLVEQYLARVSVPAVDRTDAELPPELAGQIGIELEDLREVLAENRRASEKFLSEATSSANVEAEFLWKQLGAAGVKLGRTHEQWLTELTARAVDHVWVEHVGADGAAAVLDATFAPGAGQAGPISAKVPTEGTPVADLNAERHVVQFQLIYTVNEGAAPAEKVLMDVPLYADEALYDAPMFTIEPADPVPPPSKLLEMDSATAIKLVTGFKNYQAVVRSRGMSIGSPAFDLKGNITPIAPNGRVKAAQQLAGATGGLFGDALGGGKTGAETNNFLELSVLMTIQVPGAAPATQRRVLLKQAQTTGEEFLSPILEWKILIQPQPLVPALAGFEALENTAAVVEGLLPILESSDARAGVDRVAGIKPSTHPGLLVDLSGFRENATATALRENPSITVLWDRPQIAVAEQRFCANAKTGNTCGHASIDLVDNAVSFIPRAPDAADAATRAALRQGVFDTVAEALMLAKRQGGAVAGAFDSLRSVREAGGRLAVVEASNSGGLAATSLSERDRQWIARHESSSHRIAAPAAAQQAGPSAWWSIDSQTGSVLGRRDGGRGQSTTENVVIQVLAGLGCLVFNALKTEKDRAAAGGRLTLGSSYYLSQAGCLLGMGFGVGGAVLTKSANLFTIINMLIGGAISLAT